MKVTMGKQRNTLWELICIKEVKKINLIFMGFLINTSSYEIFYPYHFTCWFNCTFI